MIVEMCGVPGAGKTTLSMRLRAELTDLDVSRSGAIRRATRSSHRAPGQVARRVARSGRHPRLVANAIGALARSTRTSSERVEALRFLGVTLDDYATARRRSGPCDIVVFEEGPIQRGFLCLVDAAGVADDRWVEGYSRALPLGGLAVHVKVPIDVAMERLRSRERQMPTRFAGLTEDATKDVMARGGALIERLLEERSKRGSESLVVDGTDIASVGKVAAAIRDALSCTSDAPSATRIHAPSDWAAE